MDKVLDIKPDNCCCINNVCDCYDFDPTMSLKGDERIRRDASLKRVNKYILNDSIEIPVWKGLVTYSSNKLCLLHYISQYWSNRNDNLIPEILHSYWVVHFSHLFKTVALKKNTII